MDQDPRTAGPQLEEPGPRSPEEIQADIEQTREQVGDTVEALAAKTDVKAQTRARVDGVKANIAAKTGDVKTSLHAKTDDVKAKVRETTPSSAQAGAGQVAAKAREHRVPLLIGGALLTAFLIGRRTAQP